MKRITSIIIFLLLTIYYYKIFSKQKEYFTNTTNYKKGTIFVSIASYRDDECPKTIKSIYDNATNPDNIFIGICQQNSEEDIDCLKDNIRSNQIRIKRLHNSQARGPTYARYICSTLLQDEEYFLQIDSHTVFNKNWDSTLISLLNKCPGENNIITHYPPSQTDNSNLLVYMCNSKFDKNGLPTLKGALIHSDNKNRQVPFIAAGMLFGKSKFVEDVPFDPYLPYLFQGEEILHSARLWTSGYNFYLPLENVCPRIFK